MRARSIFPCFALLATTAIVLGALLAGCGQTDSDPRTLPAPGGSVGAIAAQGGHGASRDADSSDRTDPANTDSASDDTSDESATDDSNGSASDVPDVPKVPGGTLTYTVVFTGLDKNGSSQNWEKLALRRTIQVTSRMRGNIAPPAEDASYTADLTSAMLACRDNDCFRQQQNAAMARADRLWVPADSCQAKAEVDDQGTRYSMNAEGVVHDSHAYTHEVRRGSAKLDCTPDALGHSSGNFDAVSLRADPERKTYKLILATLSLDTLMSDDGEPPMHQAAKIYLPEVVVSGQKFGSLGEPLSGTATVQTEAVNPDSPVMTAQVSWTFTPDKS